MISRHQGLLGNVENELNFGRAVAAVGPAVVKRIAYFHPGDPDLTLDSAINGALLSPPILSPYAAFHSTVRFQPSDVIVVGSQRHRRVSPVGSGQRVTLRRARFNERRDIGSNNWVVSGRLSVSGAPLLANDPHRAQSAPSLRYWVHLVAPGWNVIGGGEPEIPGVSIGHNERGAWGLTIFETDGEDLYVYKTNPSNARQYWYEGRWEAMRTIRESIPVKGADPASWSCTSRGMGRSCTKIRRITSLTPCARRGWSPAARRIWPVSRMDQATNWNEFRDACAYSNIPGENMIWADQSGTIGWQAVGIAPIRTHWSGLVPVPGDGRYEWKGFLPIKEKPHSVNPPAGFIATANNDLIPRGYAHMDAVGYEWADPYRWQRISEVLSAGKKLTVSDLTRLQTDYLSIPARELVPLVATLHATRPSTEDARRALTGWNFVLDTASVAAGIYEAWYRRLSANVQRVVVPSAARPFFRTLSATRLIDWLTRPGAEFGPHPVAARDSLMLLSLDEAVDELARRFGPTSASWAWGQPTYHHVTIAHMLSAAVDSATRSRLDLGPARRGGDALTVGATGGADNQTSGASFRIAMDLADWEQTRGANTPGQSGDPASPHYRDLFALWSKDRFFSVPYARAAVDREAEARQVLVPK